MRVEPITAGVTLFNRQNFDALSGDQSGVERNQRAIDFRSTAAVAEFGVHGISKIKWRGTSRKRNDFALRRQGEYLVLKQLVLEMLGKLTVAGLGTSRARTFANLLSPGQQLT